jgi:MFS family permease
VIPLVHLWLLTCVPEIRLRRGVAVALLALGVVPLGLVIAYYAGQFGLHPIELAWEGVVVVAGGYAGPAGVVVWSLILACAVVAAGVAVRRRADPRQAEHAAGVTTRGPLSYAGPGSLGGTGSALRR